MGYPQILHLNIFFNKLTTRPQSLGIHACPTPALQRLCQDKSLKASGVVRLGETSTNYTHNV